VISPETILAVRERTDILAVVGEHVPSLKRRGRSFVGLCPFHKEKSPSFHVNPDRGFYHCFGCKESGSAIDFVMKLEGATFPEAVRSLAERLGLSVEETHAAPTEVDRQKRQKDDLYAVSQLAAVFFEQQLRDHPDREYALAELDRRGLRPSFAGGHGGPEVDQALQAFRIGYAPPEWDGLAKFVRAQGISPLTAETAGLLAPRTSGAGHYDRFRHRLMFAVVDPQGRVLAFSGRALEPHPSEKRDPSDKPAKYINSPETPIYTKGAMLFGIHAARHAIRSAGEAVVVEGNFDVVSLHARGITNVVAPLGTAFTLEQAKLLRRFASDVVLLFDADAAGRKAVAASAAPLAEAGLSVRVAALPDGRDPDEVVRERGPEAIAYALEVARDITAYKLDSLLDTSFAQSDAFERMRRIEEVGRILATAPSPIVRALHKSYADQLAGRLDLVRSGPDAFRALEQVVRRAAAEAPRPAPKVVRPGLPEEGNEPVVQTARPAEARIHPRDPALAARREIVGALIECPALLEDPEVAWCVDLLAGPSVLLVRAVREAWDPVRRRLDPIEFLEKIDPVYHDFARSRLGGPVHGSDQEAKGYLLATAEKLKSLLRRAETESLARENYKVDDDFETLAERAREASLIAQAQHKKLK
jgi:DNA primase